MFFHSCFITISRFLCPVFSLLPSFPLPLSLSLRQKMDEYHFVKLKLDCGCCLLLLKRAKCCTSGRVQMRFRFYGVIFFYSCAFWNEESTLLSSLRVYTRSIQVCAWPIVVQCYPGFIGISERLRTHYFLYFFLILNSFLFFFIVSDFYFSRRRRAILWEKKWKIGRTEIQGTCYSNVPSISGGDSSRKSSGFHFV